MILKTITLVTWNHIKVKNQMKNSIYKTSIKIVHRSIDNIKEVTEIQRLTTVLPPCFCQNNVWNIK